MLSNAPESNAPESNAPESNAPPFAIGSNAPETPKITVNLAPAPAKVFEPILDVSKHDEPIPLLPDRIQAKSRPLDDACLMVHNKETGASWYVMRFKDRKAMLAYAKTRNARDDGLYGIPYDMESSSL